MEGTWKILDDPLVMTALRKEGFAHQELVVVPGPIQAASARHPLLKALQVTDAGFFPEAAAHGIERKRGASGAVLIVCLAGRGWARIGSSSAQVQAGHAILIAPGQPHSYGADTRDPWTIVWAHFRGEELAAWWRFLGLPEGGGILAVRGRAPERLELGRVHEQIAAGYDEPRLLAAASALRWSLAQLAGAGESAPGEQDGVGRVATWMRENVTQRVPVRTLARRAGLSPAHFSLCFKQHTGFAPIDYFLRLKIRRACSLLDGTTWTVERIARELGYDDAFYFSRLFRSIMGCPPRTYRKRAKG